MEMDLAVDGGLGRTDGCDWGAPCSGVKDRRPRAPRREESLCGTLPACAHTHVLKQGSPESRSIPMVTCTEGEVSHTAPTCSRGASPWPLCSGCQQAGL